MSRLAVFAVCVLAACSKSAGNQDKLSSPPSPGSPEVISVPRESAAPKMAVGSQSADQTPPSPIEDRLRLKPEEGTLRVEAPAEVKTGSEAVAKITVTPGKGYHVNTEYPIKLTIASTENMRLPKTNFVAGGHDKSKGDADTLDERTLTFEVRFTPETSGSYTVPGRFKFAVCDANQCLPKKEPISFVVAAK